VNKKRMMKKMTAKKGVKRMKKVKKRKKRGILQMMPRRVMTSKVVKRKIQRKRELGMKRGPGTKRDLGMRRALEMRRVLIEGKNPPS